MDKKITNPILTFFGTYFFAFLFYLIWILKYLRHFNFEYQKYNSKIKSLLFLVEMNVGFISIYTIILLFNTSQSTTQVTIVLPFIYVLANLITLIIAIKFTNLLLTVYREEGYSVRYSNLYTLLISFGIFLICLIPFVDLESKIILVAAGNTFIAAFVTFLQLKINRLFSTEEYLFQI
ncbi:MAG: hypothetical protein IPH62_15380 [Ignavibacteriae bacterium]|nr:hypothetical protein [Ignavibacteriota bacterium]